MYLYKSLSYSCGWRVRGAGSVVSHHGPLEPQLLARAAELVNGQKVVHLLVLLEARVSALLGAGVSSVEAERFFRQTE